MQSTDIPQLMAGMRFEPKSKRQLQAAKEGAAAMDQDWKAKNMPAFINGGLANADKYYRAAYELRYHELLQTEGL